MFSCCVVAEDCGYVFVTIWNFKYCNYMITQLIWMLDYIYIYIWMSENGWLFSFLKPKQMWGDTHRCPPNQEQETMIFKYENNWTKTKNEGFFEFLLFLMLGGQSKRFLSTSCYARTLLHKGAQLNLNLEFGKWKKW
jgi:hypothetical protein